MSLTLQPVNSNIFLRHESVEAIMEATRGHSLDNLNKAALKEEMTGRWLEDCKNHQKIPFVKRLNSMDTAQLGTTFPPRGGIHPAAEANKFGRRDTFHSEPDLSPMANFSDDDESASLCGDEDEDHLFEFDMSPERELLEPQQLTTADLLMLPSPAADVRLTAPAAAGTAAPGVGGATNTDTGIKMTDSAAVAARRHRTFSDSSNGSCSHRKAPALSVVEPDDASGGMGSVSSSSGGYRPGFSSLFGSTSSGLGSERRPSQETLIFGEDENKSFEPSEWREYMNERLSCSEGTVTPLSSSAPDISSNSGSVSGVIVPSCSNSSGEGGATPILAASPCPTPSSGGAESPLISPDSLLEGQGHLEENYLAATATNNTSCPECDRNTVGLGNLNLYENSQCDVKEEFLNRLDNNNLVNSTIPPCNVREASTPPLTEAEAAAAQKLCEEDLTHLLNRLDEDKHVYPGLHHVNSANSSLSQEEIGEEITPLRKTSAPAGLSAPAKELSPVPEAQTPKLRKCSSLKSGRTPPGTPGQRKIVRFADIFGLDLSEVKTFVDEIPKVPRSAFQDLDVDIADFDVGSPRVATPEYKFRIHESPKKNFVPVSSSSLVPMFTQPGCSTAFYDTVRTNKLCLENAFMEAPFVIGGIVRVLNIDFNKSVMVRWTVNDWHSHNDTMATYVDGSSDGVTDKFSFRIEIGCLPVGSRVQFCLQYCCAGNQFWDNNYGGNYVFQVFLNTNSPGGSGGTIRSTSPPSSSLRSSSQSPVLRGSSAAVLPRSSPVAVAVPKTAYSSPTYQNYTQSPSHHGDEPWMRFM